MVEVESVVALAGHRRLIIGFQPGLDLTKDFQRFAILFDPGSVSNCPLSTY